MSVRLKGITWDHPRGYAPMIATAARWTEMHPDVTITWDKRSLQAFGDFPLDRLADDYDLLVIDHPHVGICARKNILLPVDQPGREALLKHLAENSVGACHTSYVWDDRQWALAIDAASQVSVRRPDLLPDAPQTWEDVRELARARRVLWPLKPIDAIMSFFSIAAGWNLVHPQNDELIAEQDGEAVLAFMAAFAALLPDKCLAQSPINVLEELSHGDQFAYCPLLFCYSNYARPGNGAQRLVFRDVPKTENGSRGVGILGGTGLAISARCAHPDAALDYAYWVAGEQCQRTLYFTSGGQPAHRSAWLDPAVNKASEDFFEKLYPSLQCAWLRPRHPGYLEFQDKAGDLINHFLRTRGSAQETVRALRDNYRRTCNSLG